jgi:hypothetical protein
MKPATPGNLFRALLTAGVIACCLAAPVGAQEKPVGDKTATPATQALKIYQAVRDQDYTAMYYLFAFTPKGRATITTPEQFAIDMKKGYDGSFKTPQEKIETDAIFRSISDIMVGEPVITDNMAAIPVSAKITLNGQAKTFKGQAHLILDDGVWKLDLTFTEDSEQATSQRVGEIFGKPEPAK